MFLLKKLIRLFSVKTMIKFLVSEREDTHYVFDDVIKEYIKEHNTNWREIPDHPYKVLGIGGSGSGKTNALLSCINNEPDIDQTFLYAKDPNGAKYKLLINKRKNTGSKYLNDSKAFTEYSNNNDIYKI